MRLTKWKSGRASNVSLILFSFRCLHFHVTANVFFLPGSIFVLVFYFFWFCFFFVSTQLCTHSFVFSSTHSTHFQGFIIWPELFCVFHHFLLPHSLDSTWPSGTDTRRKRGASVAFDFYCTWISRLSKKKRRIPSRGLGGTGFGKGGIRAGEFLIKFVCDNATTTFKEYPSPVAM